MNNYYRNSDLKRDVYVFRGEHGVLMSPHGMKKVQSDWTAGKWCGKQNKFGDASEVRRNNVNGMRSMLHEWDEVSYGMRVRSKWTASLAQVYLKGMK